MSTPSPPPTERYRLGERVGAGGMAEVYAAHDRLLGVRVAVKVLTLTSRAIETRLLREGRIQASLQHPNVLPVTDVIRVTGRPALVMPFVSGPTLAQVLARRDLSLAHREALFRGVVAGIRAAHAAGLVHRDLKPSNVLVQPTPEGPVPRVADFGLAKVLGEPDGVAATRSGVPLGTLQYMAPEQHRDASRVDHRVDLWALGCVLYEVACRRPAFREDDPVELVQAVVHGRFVPPRDHEPDLPARLVRAIEACLQVDRDDRVPTCEALLTLLGREDPPSAWPTALAHHPPTDGHAGEGPSTPPLPGGAPEGPGTSARPSTWIQASGAPAHRRWLAVFDPRRPGSAVSLGLLGLVGLGATLAMGTSALAPSDPPVDAIAVLPFEVRDLEARWTWLGHGLAEEVSTALSREGALDVAARASSEAAATRGLDVRQIGQALGVDAVVTGTVEPGAEGLRVTVTLADARSGFERWTHVYDRPRADLLPLRADVARDIHAALSITLRPDGASALGPSDPQTFQQVVRARELWRTRDVDRLVEAVGLLREATAREPGWAEAWATLAGVVDALAWRSRAHLPLVAEGLAAAEQAIALDPGSAQAHAALGVLLSDFGSGRADAERAEAALTEALRLDPGLAPAHLWLGDHLLREGRLDDALVHLRQASARDPLSHAALGAYAEGLAVVGRWEDARALMWRAFTDFPFDALQAWHLLALGPRLGLGAAELQQVADALSDHVPQLGGDDAEALVVGLLDPDRAAPARAWLRAWPAGGRPRHLAAIAAALGEPDLALDILEEVYPHDDQQAFLGVHASWDPLRDTPRFQALLDRLGLRDVARGR